MSHDEYLRNFFAALESLQPGESCGLSHAITFENGAIYVLVGMGDEHAKIRVQELDPDPNKMSAEVIAMWQASIKED